MLRSVHIFLGQQASICSIRPLPQPIGSELRQTTSTADEEISSRNTEMEKEQGIVEHNEDPQSFLPPAQSKCRKARHVIRTVYNLLFTSYRTSSSIQSTGLFSCNWDQYKTTYTLSLHLRLPDFIGRKVLNLGFTAR